MRNAKIHTSSFYLSKALLEEINALSEILGISRSVLIERAIYGKEKGYEKAERHITPRKKTQKIPTQRGKYKAIKRRRAQSQAEQKCLFDYMPCRVSYIFV